MKLQLITFLFSFLLGCSAFATTPTLELKFDNKHSVYSVPDGKLWLLGFEKTDVRYLSNIFPDEGLSLSILEDAFTNYDCTKSSLNILKSLKVKLKPGESLVLYVEEIDLTNKELVDYLSLFECWHFPYDSIYRLIRQFNPESERPGLFLSALAKVYKQPFTEEKYPRPCNSYDPDRFTRLIVCGEKAEVFIRLVPAWCGVFYWYHGMNKYDVQISGKEYDERSKKSKEEAVIYWQNKKGEK